MRESFATSCTLVLLCAKNVAALGALTPRRLCGFPPFYHEKIPLLFESIMRADYDYPAEYWDHISDDGASSFITS